MKLSFEYYYAFQNVFFFCLLFFLFMFCRFLYYKNYSGLQVGMTTYESIRTGDIFIVSYNRPLLFVFEGIMGINYEHTCIALRDETGLYIVEFAMYPHKKDLPDYRGIIKIPFSIWLRHNKSSFIVRNKINYSDENSENKLSAKIEEFYQKTKYDKSIGSLNLGWLRFPFPSDKYKKPVIGETNLTCIEYNVYLLAETGIIINPRSLEYYDPQKYIDMKGFDVNEEYKYSKSEIIDVKMLYHMID